MRSIASPILEELRLATHLLALQKPMSLPGNMRAFVCALLFVILTGSARGQALEQFSFTTDGSGVLTSRSAPVFITETAEGSFFDFKIGFETMETALPSTILDSISISIYLDDPRRTALIGTLDATGLAVAPANPGGIFLAPESISFTLEPSRPDALPTHFDLSGRMELPDEFTGRQVNAIVDFFNNQSQGQSLGYATFATIPEPAVWQLFLLSGACCLAVRRKGRR